MWLSRVVLEVAVKMSSRNASEGLSETGGSASKRTHSHDWQVDAGFWREALVLYHVDISVGCLCLLKGPHDHWLPLEQVIQEKIRQKLECLKS